MCRVRIHRVAMMLMWRPVQGNGRFNAPGPGGAGAFGSFVSGAAPASVAASAKPLHTISEVRPAHQATMPDSYYADDSPSAAAPPPPQPSLAFSSKRISTGTFNIFPSAHNPAAAMRAQRHPSVQPQHSSVAHVATLASTDPHGGTAMREDRRSQQRPSVAAGVTAALVAGAMASSANIPARRVLDREDSMHSTPAAEGPQHVYDSDGAPASGSASRETYFSAAAARAGGAVGSVSGAAGGSVTTRSDTVSAAYDPLNDARKEQRMVELASLLTRDHPSGARDVPEEAAVPPRADQPDSARSCLPQAPAPGPRPQDPEDAAAPPPCPTGDAEGSLYRNIAIPKPTSSSFEDRSMERSVDSAFRVCSPTAITPPPSANPVPCSDTLYTCTW